MTEYSVGTSIYVATYLIQTPATPNAGYIASTLAKITNGSGFSGLVRATASCNGLGSPCIASNNLYIPAPTLAVANPTKAQNTMATATIYTPVPAAAAPTPLNPGVVAVVTEIR